ncbi:hypothetical protein IJH89_00655 [Candidatus Saccharibacteria bacterium]|nr:hypothetical protein [Candidatus Saccharibacteria bacterium]
MPKRLGSTLSAVFVLALCAAVYFNRLTISDYFKGRTYAPTTEMSEIRSALKLTPRGTRIFNATAPVLDSRDNFNLDCNSSNPDIAVYGCYSLDRIYIYDINLPELAGFRESTTAHELLHAVWFRLSDSKKSELTPLLESAFEENRATLEESLKTYDDSERLDELYVRLATQVKNLPAPLESHYSEIFTNQDEVVDFYYSYLAPFEELKKTITTLGSEIESLKSDIDVKFEEYNPRSATFSSEVDEFNSCAARVGCFSSEAEFNSRRATLVAEQTALNALYSELSALIDAYNSKIDVYNSNVLNLNTLQDLVNSNSKHDNL